jgi:hypothetical protein
MSGCADLRDGSRGVPLLARMASSSFGFYERHFVLASCQFLSRTILDLAGFRFTSRSIRRGIADRPHGPAFAAHDRRSAFDLARRATDAVIARFAAKVCAIRCRSIVSVAADAVGRACSLATCGLLARWSCGIDGMASSGGVYARIAIGTVARRRARMFLRGRISFLVARCPALAECPDMAAMVDPRLPFSCYPAMRHPLRISCVLRSCCLRGLPLRTKALWHFRSRRPAMRRRADVDLRHDRLSASRRNSYYAAAVAAEFPGK